MLEQDDDMMKLCLHLKKVNAEERERGDVSNILALRKRILWRCERLYLSIGQKSRWLTSNNSSAMLF